MAHERQRPLPSPHRCAGGEGTLTIVYPAFVPAKQRTGARPLNIPVSPERSFLSVNPDRDFAVIRGLSSPVRIRNRCEVTGRPRAYYRKLKMSRIALRELGSQGQIPGLVKSSW